MRISHSLALLLRNILNRDIPAKNLMIRLRLRVMAQRWARSELATLTRLRTEMGSHDRRHPHAAFRWTWAFDASDHPGRHCVARAPSRFFDCRSCQGHDGTLAAARRHLRSFADCENTVMSSDPLYQCPRCEGNESSLDAPEHATRSRAATNAGTHSPRRIYIVRDDG